MKLRVKVSFVAAWLMLLAASFPAGATFPGTNGKIVFVGDRSGSWQLYTIDSDGRNLTQITDLAKTDFDLWMPSFSPDGKQIVFCYGNGNSAESGASEIYLINADGSGLKQLTNDGSFDCAPRWSPDGKTIVFARTFVPTNQTLISTIRLDGTGQITTLTKGDFRFWGTFLPTYTPDGKRITFFSSLQGLVSAVWIMDMCGADPKRLTRAALEGFAWDVSPDGLHILVTDHQNTGLPIAIYTMNINGKNLKRITHLQHVHELAGSYSPDGKKIVFFSDRLNTTLTFDLFAMNPDGTDIERIAANVGTCPDENCVDATWGSKPSQ